MEDPAEGIARIVREEVELQGRMDAEAEATAHALIQGYLGPTTKSRACKAARQKGHDDCRAAGDVRKMVGGTGIEPVTPTMST